MRRGKKIESEKKNYGNNSDESHVMSLHDSSSLTGEENLTDLFDQNNKRLLMHTDVHEVEGYNNSEIHSTSCCVEENTFILVEFIYM